MVDSPITTLDLQQALIAAGYSVGSAGADGMWGRDTLAAVKKFQAANGLPPSGIVGPRTVAALIGRSYLAPRAAILPIPWLELAEQHIGLTETPGVKNTPEILEWADDLNLPVYTADSIPWCGLFMGHVIATALPEEPLPSNVLWAKAWAKFGVPLPAPAIGCVAVMERPGGGGHVTLYTGEDGKGAFRGLGGNQSDKVGYAWLAMSRVIAWRWPRTVHLPIGRKVILSRNGGLSTNEA